MCLFLIQSELYLNSTESEVGFYFFFFFQFKKFKLITQLFSAKLVRSYLESPSGKLSQAQSPALILY